MNCPDPGDSPVVPPDTPRQHQIHRITGFIWHSRQIEIAAAHADGPTQVLLNVVDQAAEVAVIYDNNRSRDRWFTSQVVFPDLSVGAGFNFVEKLAVQLGLYAEH